jgi:hypothetical protein
MADDETLNVPEEGTNEQLPPAGGEDQDSGAWPKEAQAEYTKKTQALADERKQWDSQRAQQQQQLQHYAQQLQQQQYAHKAAQQYAQPQQAQASNPTQTMLDQLRGMPYLDGNTAAQLMERIVNEGINPLQQKVAQRDQAIAQLYKDYNAMREHVGKNQGKQAERELDARFAKFRQDSGLPDEEVVNEYLKDVYYSHEGDDLNDQYPEMAKSRIDGLKKVFRNMDRQAAVKAKTSQFPSKGGESSLTNGKTGGYKSPADRADELWPMMNPGQTE